MPGSLTLFSGNTTIAPLTFVSGTNLATAVAGAIASKLTAELYDFVKKRMTGSGLKIPVVI